MERRLLLLQLNALNLTKTIQDDTLGGFLNFTTHEHLIDHRIDLVEVENKIELTHALEELIKQLDKEVDGLKIEQFVIVDINAEGEVKGGIASVDELIVTELDDARELTITVGDDLVNFTLREIK